jgi:amidase
VSHSRNMGFLRPPSVEDVAALGDLDHLALSQEECSEITSLAGRVLGLLDDVEALPELEGPVRYPRTPGHRPSAEEDPVNAFVRILAIQGAETGPLAGRRIGVKDNTAVAGVPVTNGSRTLSYTPRQDAVVVERILDAGGVIAGKLNLDDFSAAGFGDTSAFGPPRNPIDPTRTAGGSSSGSSAAVAAGLVDMALGVDQGGSVRSPAAACGVVGMKPTHGLVPTFGVTHLDHTLDTIGPITRSVADAATLLAVIAGPDWRDPQWTRDVVVDDYVAGLQDGVAGLRVGIVEEAIRADASDAAVVDGLNAAGAALQRAGAEVEHVSIPIWKSGFSIWLGVMLATWAPMLRNYSVGFGHLGLVEVDRVHTASLVRRTEGHLLPPLMKLVLVVNAYLGDRYHGVPLARAHNQRLALRRTLDETMERFDLLLAPTLARVAPALPEGPVTAADVIGRAITDARGGGTMNATGNPSLALPSGRDEAGLPTSVQVIGRRGEDRRVLAAAAAIEAGIGT